MADVRDAMSDGESYGVGETSDVAETRRLARRRGIVAFAVGALLAALAVVAFAIGPWSPAFPTVGAVFAADALLAVILGTVALSVAGRYPAVGHLAGIVDVAWIAAIAASVGGIVVFVATSVDIATLLGLTAVLAATAGIVWLLASAERRVVRSPGATLPR